MKKGYTVRKYNEPVKRYCQTLSLKNNPGLIAEYRRIQATGSMAHIRITNTVISALPSILRLKGETVASHAAQ